LHPWWSYRYDGHNAYRRSLLRHTPLRIEPRLSGASIVLVGNFNPAIFSPAWFLRNDLITVDEHDATQTHIVHPQIAQFQTEWFQLTVDLEKFSISTAQDPPIRICDLTLRTFTEFLPHTPLTRIGINRQVHFSVGSQDRRDSIGYRLAPPEAWGEWASAIRSGQGPRHGGMTSLTMQQRDLDDREAGHISATVQPSTAIKGECGVYVQVNDHYEFAPATLLTGAGRIMEILRTRFDSSQARSDWIVDQIMALADAS
jgi:hypothetical protein